VFLIPRAVKLSGRTFHCFALKNLVSAPPQLPDLILHRSSVAVPEYNIQILMPGMFPLCFRWTGWFDNPARHTKLSFEAKPMLSLMWRTNHLGIIHSYIFVALNIIQRRLSHLHTHFTVRQSKFDSMPKDLTTVSSEVLQTLADHLQQEKKMGCAQF